MCDACEICLLYLFCTGGGGDGCHLRVVPPGQLHRRPSTPKRFCLSAVFIEPGFMYFLFREVSFSCVFCVCFPVVQGFSPRLLRLFSNSFQVKFFIYSLYIYLFFIFFIFSLFFVLHFIVLMVSLWHPGDGRDFRKKPLPYY